MGFIFHPINFPTTKLPDCLHPNVKSCSKASSLKPVLLKMIQSTSRRTMSAMATNVRDAKKLLRKEIKVKVAKISDEDKIIQSRKVTELVLQMPEYQKANSLSIYLHMNDEIQTEELLKHSLKQKKKCYIPRYFMGGNHMEMVLLRDMDDYINLPLTKWNIKQPRDDEERPEALDHGLDLMLIPGMAFSKEGHRLGRGKGYYDTYLAKAKAKYRFNTVALAFKEQVLPSVPTDDHDFLIDAVLYPI